MRIEIDTNTLENSGLTPSDYVILKLLAVKEYDILFSIMPLGYLNERIKHLETFGHFLKNQKGIITSVGDLTLISLRQITLDLFGVTDFDRKFAEFWSSYPLKVTTKTGETRPLRSSSLESKEAEEIKKKYKKILEKSPMEHDRVISGLHKELEQRRKANSLGFMQLVSTWINQRTYEKYCDQPEEVERYGEDI